MKSINPFARHFPLAACVVWNIIVIVISTGLVVHFDEWKWIFLCILVAWPEE